MLCSSVEGSGVAAVVTEARRFKVLSESILSEPLAVRTAAFPAAFLPSRNRSVVAAQGCGVGAECGHGVRNLTLGACECRSGWPGHSCSVKAGAGCGGDVECGRACFPSLLLSESLA